MSKQSREEVWMVKKQVAGSLGLGEEPELSKQGRQQLAHLAVLLHNLV